MVTLFSGVIGSVVTVVVVSSSCVAMSPNVDMRTSNVVTLFSIEVVSTVVKTSEVVVS